MDLVYFIEDLHKALDCSTSQQESNFNYLYGLLPEKKITLDTKRCSHIIKSGVRRFQECGHPCIEGDTVCEQHSDKKSLIAEQPQNEIKKITGAVRIRKNKYNHFLYPNTKLVFSSATDKTIIGIENQIGQLVPLNEESIQQCIQLSLKYKLN
jgi:hypothetical protein